MRPHATYADRVRNLNANLCVNYIDSARFRGASKRDQVAGGLRFNARRYNKPPHKADLA
jgi:hypothetical protein